MNTYCTSENDRNKKLEAVRMLIGADCAKHPQATAKALGDWVLWEAVRRNEEALEAGFIGDEQLGTLATYSPMELGKLVSLYIEAVLTA